MWMHISNDVNVVQWQNDQMMVVQTTCTKAYAKWDHDLQLFPKEKSKVQKLPLMQLALDKLLHVLGIQF